MTRATRHSSESSSVHGGEPGALASCAGSWATTKPGSRMVLEECMWPKTARRGQVLRSETSLLVLDFPEPQVNVHFNEPFRAHHRSHNRCMFSILTASLLGSGLSLTLHALISSAKGHRLG